MRRLALGVIGSDAYSLHRGNGAHRAARKLDTAWMSAEARPTSGITALRIERQRIVTEAAKTNAAKGPSGWW
ncbi:hypothetical protein GCM10010260_05690 [Streptomyces filipinensis]|uniref:Uncharacterized protein n=1 Tax=Streptomyces filipinensis TaxID=66887 RepID=A0A918I7G6_9ACTN|nr:hypothetical protein GCM10010260_05690 [Streptomyces filipinensis]